MAKKEQKDLKALLTLETSDKSPCEKEITFKLSSADIAHEYSLVLRDVRNTASIPGFRPGKAPEAMMRLKYDKIIRNELLAKIMQTGMEKLADNKVKVVSYSHPEKAPELKMDSDFEYKLIVNTAPEFSIPDYKSFDIEMPEVKVSPEQVDDEIGKIRERYADFGVITSSAQVGDLLKASYTSDAKDKPDFSKVDKMYIESQETWIWLSEPELFPGVNKALSGAMPGDKVSFSSSFPEDFRDKEVAGKTVQYEVSVNEIQRRKPLESDEILCKRTSVENMESLRLVIEQRLIYSQTMHNIEGQREKIIGSLVSAAGDFALPPAILSEQINSEFMAIARTSVKNETDVEAFTKEKDKHMADAKISAERKLRIYFIMSKIAENENIRLEENELESYLGSASKAYKTTKRELKERLEENGGLEDIKMNILITKVADSIIRTIRNKKDQQENTPKLAV